jgi:cyclophilin family peptidyl-prolyl cis-trans isomerase
MIDVRDGMIKGLVVSDVQKSVAVPSLPMTANVALKHDTAGVLGVSAPNAFYLTLQKNPGLDKTGTAIGRTIAGLDLLRTVKKGDAIRSIRIVRVGQAARDFKTDDEAFKKLLESKK